VSGGEFKNSELTLWCQRFPSFYCFPLSLLYHRIILASLVFLLLLSLLLSLHFLVLVFLWSCLSTQSTIVSSIPSLWICHYDFLTREDPRRTGPHQRFSGPFNQRSGIFPFFLVNGYAYFFPSF